MKMKVETLAKVIEKILKNYKREIEKTENINITEITYYDESTETFRREIIIDYPIPKKYKKNDSSLMYA
jgi:hypothetical protein